MGLLPEHLGMSNIEIFPTRKVVDLIRKARKAAEVPLNGPEGWSRSSVDPMGLLETFRPLRIKAGFVLRAYQFRSGGNGNGVVYAMAADLPFPEPDECEHDLQRFLEPPVPNGALGQIMEAVEGDRSLWSYLAASILARELAEFGAIWHGCNWSTHDILGKDPISIEGRAGPRRKAPHDTISDFDPRGWTWVEKRPTEWRPTTTVRTNSIRVVFHTYNGLGENGIYRHIDTYKRDSYCPTSQSLVLARGEGGYIF